jgi:hypothetical protein
MALPCAPSGRGWEERGAKDLAPGGACCGCRSRFACGLLRSSSCYPPGLISRACVVVLHLWQLAFRAFADLLGGPGDPLNRRGGGPLAAGPGAWCQRGTPHETRCALGPRLLRVHGSRNHDSLHPPGSASNVDGDGCDPAHRVPVCHPRGLPLHGWAGPSDLDRGGGDILRFVARHVAHDLVESCSTGLALPLPCAVDRGIHLVGCSACYRGGATPRLIPDSCLSIVAVLRALQETGLPRTPFGRSSQSSGLALGASSPHRTGGAGCVPYAWGIYLRGIIVERREAMGWPSS